MDTSFFATHPWLVVALALVIGAYAGMVLMACLVTAGRTDRQLEREARQPATKPASQCGCEWSDCCLHGGDVDRSRCPLRVRGGA